jgi:DNA polymerase III epsilon subunit family exonuclease
LSDAEGHDIPLGEVTFTVLDVETTGLTPHFGDRICEIALLRCRGGREVGRFQSLVDPGRPISPGARAVNGISDEELAGAPTFPEISPTVLDFLEDSVIVAHNAPFDLSFLSRELELCGYLPITNVIIDTLALARRCYRFPSNRLGSVARYLGVDTCGEHRALADVLTTRGILDRFLAALMERGAKTLAQLMEAQGGRMVLHRREALSLPPQIEEALEGGTRLSLRYVSARGEETLRMVTPLSVEAYGGHLYLVAMCHLRHEQRSFRLDRVVEMGSHGDADGRVGTAS